MSNLRGLIVDFYGVLTDGIDSAMRAWSELDDIDYTHFQDAMAGWFGDFGGFEARFNPVHALERGEMEIPDFEKELASRLMRRDGTPVQPDGLVERMFSRFEHAHDMAGLVRRAKASGVRTALLSNSWGDQYLRDGWHNMFDEVVISGEVGMRKPERRIFEHTLAELGLPAKECVFVDDHVANIRAAAELGIVGVWHRGYDETARELEALFARNLA
ncbi:MAG TPA: HAD family phosphatase [Actinomycetes bacterium]|nr:HAD family phosphatase [Actinomycetes bacterium]